MSKVQTGPIIVYSYKAYQQFYVIFQQNKMFLRALTAYQHIGHEAV